MNMVVGLKLGFAVVLTMTMVAVYWMFENRSTLFRFLRPIHTLAFGLGLRLLVFFGAFIVFHIPFGSDMQSVRYDFGRAIRDGKLPYVDVDSDYGPLFPYLFAPAIADTYETSALGIAFISTLIECASFYFLWCLINKSLPVSQAIRWSILYVLCPLPYLFSIIGHQDETWNVGIYSLVLLVILGLSSRQRMRAFIAGIILAVGGLFTKSTTALPLGLIFGFLAIPSYFLAGMALVGVSFVLFFFPVIPLMINAFTQATWPDNPSIWYLPQIITGNPTWVTENNSILAFLTFLLTVGTSVLLAIIARHRRLFERPIAEQVHFFLYAWVIVWLVFSLVTPKGLMDYALFWMPAALFLYVVRPDALLRSVMAGFCVIAAVHPSLSYRLLPVERYTDLSVSNQQFMLVLDGIIYIVYIVILRYTVRQLRSEYSLLTPLVATKVRTGDAIENHTA